MLRAQFLPDKIGQYDTARQARQKIDLVNQDKVTRRTCICDDNGHVRLKSKSFHGPHLLLNFFKGELLIDLVGLEKAVQFVTCLQAERAAEFRLR